VAALLLTLLCPPAGGFGCSNDNNAADNSFLLMSTRAFAYWWFFSIFIKKFYMSIWLLEYIWLCLGFLDILHFSQGQQKVIKIFNK
jgi:hypothetical protein